MEGYSLLYSSSHRTQLFAGFQRLRSQEKMCDVILEAGGVSFPCHRALLASSSDYFWALFGDGTAESRAGSISLPALTPQGLEIILDFLYSGWLSMSASTLPVVLKTARYLQVETALSICERFMMDSLNAENCCCYANLADCLALSNISEAAHHSIAMAMKDLLQDNREDLLTLNIRSLTAVLDADEIPGVKELELVKLTLSWLDENGPLPLLKSNVLLSRLRFGLIAPLDLMKLGCVHKAMATPLIRGQLTRTLEYHSLGPAQPIAQSRHSTLRESPHRVVLVGGGASADWPEQQVWVFDPRSRKCLPTRCVLPARLRSFCVCSLGGFLFVLGGDELKVGEGGAKTSVTMETSNRMWRFDPRFGCWEEAESMLERRAQFTCCLLQDVIFVIGGRHTLSSSNTHAAVASVEFYDMAAGKWRRGVSMPRPLHGHASAILEDSLYVSGGLPGAQGCHYIGLHGNREVSRDVLSWNLRDRVWEKKASMSIGRFSHRLAAAHGFLYALLGMYEPFCDIERYDPRADHWTRLKPLLFGSFHYGMASTASGSLLLFGGRRWRDGQEETVKSVLEYDTMKDQWREICQLPRELTGTECTRFPLPDWTGMDAS
ncbi:kelch-like protein 34 [Oryzias melastigma]|uniref:Kelch like family member 34 n=1 Tax=Oryzias melastigma TaxID=30732 RepID=A0A3B3B3L7_ORYME|nr:kelch-like protein 34 [Oryzias melastigma]